MELILGGARSGKTRLAMQRAEAGAGPLIYLATATAEDAEMIRRVDRHRAERGPAWHTVEEPLRLADRLRELAVRESTIVVDCLTLWISNCLHHDCWEREREALLQWLDEPAGPGLRCVFVSNEVGSGIVPLGALSREFVDASGWLHQALASRLARVTLVVAGLPLTLKESQ